MNNSEKQPSESKDDGQLKCGVCDMTFNETDLTLFNDHLATHSTDVPVVKNSPVQFLKRKTTKSNADVKPKPKTLDLDFTDTTDIENEDAASTVVLQYSADLDPG